MLLAVELTEGIAKLAAGSILLTALLVAGMVLKVQTRSTSLKAFAVVLAVALSALAIVLFNATERNRTTADAAANQKSNECRALARTVKQGLRDKLLFEQDVNAAKQIARGLVETIDASSCDD